MIAGNGAHQFRQTVIGSLCTNPKRLHAPFFLGIMIIIRLLICQNYSSTSYQRCMIFSRTSQFQSQILSLKDSHAEFQRLPRRSWRRKRLRGFWRPGMNEDGGLQRGEAEMVYKWLNSIGFMVDITIVNGDYYGL